MPQRILLAVDGSDTSWRALREAVKFARPDDVVRVVNVVEGPIGLYPIVPSSCLDVEKVRDGLIDEGQRLLGEAFVKLRDEGVQADARSIDLRVWGGTIADAILREAERWHADVLVLGTHGRRGVRRLMFGSVAEQVLRQAHRPVLLVAGNTVHATSAGRPIARAGD
ncbi:Stress response protein NhaX [Pandoraea terrae]|uniref:Stress response protein NhaX n=1 Tax=Pandoraea terrae TaxID=1537710 RepID=A0A5E4S267_9BURK|nr:Stress response protein NhaX [Pandoraea terrae]